MNAYIKIGEFAYYKISDGKVLVVNVSEGKGPSTMSIKNLNSLPTAYVERVTVVTEQEFEAARAKVLKLIS